MNDNSSIERIDRPNIVVNNFGPIRRADVSLGDLTILLGPQASGKTLFLQLFKLAVDKSSIIDTLHRYNYVIDRNPDKILNYYFGDRLSSLWRPDTSVRIDDRQFNKHSLILPENNLNRSHERVFYIPAQRVLTISEGTPKNFMEYNISTPYVLRGFSETLRLFFQHDTSGSARLFPIHNRLKNSMRRAFNKSIFHGGQVVIDEESGQKKMRMSVGGSSLPFMAWSAGQKEFMPLLMAVYCLSGPVIRTINREHYRHVIIEEPEMGLHPKALQSVILEMLELINAGYKVIVSTHSPVMMEFAWAYRNILRLPPEQRKEALCRLFDVDAESTMCRVFDNTADMDVRTYSFNHGSDGMVTTSDISNLDPFSEDAIESEWGGLSQFATRASEIVSEYMAALDE